MKTAYDKNLKIFVEVSIDTPVRTKDGIHYLLDAEDEVEQAQRATNALAEQLRALPKKLRIAVETEAHTVNGMDIVLDSKTETRLLSALTRMQVVGNTTTTWKAENGFFTIGQEDIVAIGTVIGEKISKAFNAQRVLEQEIADGTITTVASAKIRFEELTNA